MEEPLNYLDLAAQGKNTRWHIVGAVAALLLPWLICGSSPTLLLGFYALTDSDPNTIFDSPTNTLIGVHPVLPFIAGLLGFVFLLFGLYIAVRYIHQRPFHTLFTSTTFNWSRLWQAAGLWTLLSLLFTIFAILLFRGRYELTFQPINFIIFLFFSLLLVPLQTSAEELVFRAYVLQSFGLRVRSPMLLCLISGALFALPHLATPELSFSVIQLVFFFFCFGFFLAYLTLESNGLELALGVHAAHNLFTVLFVNYRGAALTTAPIFTAKFLDVNYGLFTFFITAIIFYIWFFKLGPPSKPAAPTST
jgi:hypothetical protein